MELELGLDPDDAARLPRLALLAPLKSGRPRNRAVRIVWHDSPDRALARQGLALAQQRPQWRLERLLPDTRSWPPGAPAPVLATGRDVAALGETLPEPLVPIAALEGRAVSRSLATEQGPVGMTLLNGTVRAVATECRISRLRLEGAAEAVQPLAIALVGELRLAVPRASLAAEAFAATSGVEPSPRREGAPELPAGLSVAEAFAHVVGHLSDVILYFAPKAADGQRRAGAGASDARCGPPAAVGDQGVPKCGGFPRGDSDGQGPEGACREIGPHPRLGRLRDRDRRRGRRRVSRGAADAAAARRDGTTPAHLP